MTPIAAAADNSSNTTVREGDDSGSMLSDKNVEEAEIKKKAPISTVLQSCKVSSSGPKSLSNECLHNKYLKPVQIRKNAVQSKKDTLSKKEKHTIAITGPTKKTGKRKSSRHKYNYPRTMWQFFPGYGWYQGTVSDEKLKDDKRYTVSFEDGEEYNYR